MAWAGQVRDAPGQLAGRGLAGRELAGRELAGRVYRQARCAASCLDPDEWFPLASDVARARDQAARAIAVCAGCPVRADCLELAMRRPSDIGAYGVWGGLVEGERRALRRRWLEGASARELLWPGPAGTAGG